ncbi:MAG: RecX family transcriptional regulator [Micavibrio sp.]|nr:RecX family transcriptional regulator [Micavibrio sp.]|tara:strand:+ start:1638 stop:2261 length:624 start_codon:yes stop_codon:yes gene_type:complete
MEQHKSQRPNSKSQRPKKPIKKTPKRITETYLHNAGLYYLQRFSSSSGNFRRVMLNKIEKSCRAHPDQSKQNCIELLETLIKKFEELDLLNDSNYTRSQVHALRRRGKSARYIHNHLASKALSKELIDEMLKLDQNEHNQEDLKQSDIEAAFIHARKKRIGPYRRTDLNKEINLNKELANMARAGFSYEIAQKVLNTEPQDIPQAVY